MHVRTVCRTDGDTDAVVAALDAALAEDTGPASAVVALYDSDHDAATLRAFLTARFPGAAWIGGSSNGGIVDRQAAHGPGTVGLWILSDEDGDFGAASADKAGPAADAAEDALRRAIDRSGNAGDLPDLVWILQAPGTEEAALEGLRRVVGDRCPIVGGSSADNDLSGAWSQIGPDGAFGGGIAVLAFFCSDPPEVHFRGGYEPGGAQGTASAVERADGARCDAASGRVLRSIDGRPAAEVYDAWTGGAIAAKRGEGGTILAETSLFPLGVETGELDGVSQYLLIHPETVRPDGAITTFADVAEGARLHCMTGDPQLLVERAGTVARQARDLLGDRRASGALVIFCGGCRMAVGDGWHDLPAQIAGALGDAPFLCGFTFGEQGPSAGRNAHGNLMISAVVFP